LHAQQGHTLTLTYMCISLFCMINTMIAAWEIALFIRSKWITDSFATLKKKHEQGSLPPIFMFQDVSAKDALSLGYWANVWLLYSFFDASYAQCTSYGFWIDTGNGFSTLLPSVFFALGLSLDILSPLHLGLLGLIQFYQEFYGTVLYFSSFIYNKRWTEHGWKGASLTKVWTLVITSNGLWFLGPGLGMVLSYSFVAEGASALKAVRG